MGIRPHMSLVFGLDDFDYKTTKLDYEELGILSMRPTDSEVNKDNWLMFIRDIVTMSQSDTATDLLYFGKTSTSNTIIGLKIDRSYYDDCLLRALSVMLPQLSESGKFDVPAMIPDEHPGRVRQLENESRPLPPNIEWQWSWFYPAIIEMLTMWPVYTYCLLWMLKRIGITEVDYKKFKLMIVWDWC